MHASAAKSWKNSSLRIWPPTYVVVVVVVMNWFSKLLSIPLCSTYKTGNQRYRQIVTVLTNRINDLILTRSMNDGGVWNIFWAVKISSRIWRLVSDFMRGKLHDLFQKCYCQLRLSWIRTSLRRKCILVGGHTVYRNVSHCFRLSKSADIGVYCLKTGRPTGPIYTFLKMLFNLLTSASSLP